LGHDETADRLPTRRGEYVTTEEAAKYLRMSVSRLLRLADLAYLRGRPNVYRRQDLDDWFERNKTGQGLVR
jgi:hypothetical protein